MTASPRGSDARARRARPRGPRGPVRGRRRIAAAWPGARLLTTDGLGHRRVLRDAGVVAEAAGFVLERLPRCACGRLATGQHPGEPRCASCLLSLHLGSRGTRGPRERLRVASIEGLQVDRRADPEL